MEGNVFKMLLGSIDAYWDEQPSHPIPDAATQNHPSGKPHADIRASTHEHEDHAESSQSSPERRHAGAVEKTPATNKAGPHIDSNGIPTTATIAHDNEEQLVPLSNTLISTNNLGSIPLRQEEYGEAETNHQRAREETEYILGPEPPDTGTGVNQLEAVLKSPGDSAEEETFVREQHKANSSVGSGTYIGQNSVGTSQDQTLVALDETKNMAERESIDIPDDSSIASHTTTRPERLGKDYIARFLADDGEVRALCLSVLHKSGRDHSVDFGREMLKSFHLGLLEHAKTELEKQSARLLKSRSGRMRICEEIADIITSEHTQNEEEKRRGVEQLQLAELRLEMFARDVLDNHSEPNAVQPPKEEEDLQIDYSEDLQIDYSDVIEEQLEVESDNDDLPNLAKVKEFFRASEPFQILLNDFRTQLLPSSLRDVIQTAPHNSIWLSDQQSNPLSNRIKTFIEDSTMLEWNWWPLEPRMRLLNPNETRLFWYCVSR